MVIHEGWELAPAVRSYLAYCQKTRRLSHHTCAAYYYDLSLFLAALAGELIDVSVVVVALRNTIENPNHKAATVARKVSAVTPHMFRHTAATLLMEGGVDIRIIQRLLGHADISTTEIYTYVSDEALRSALERADVMQRFAGC
jgi:site-specific recombinase XerD